MSPTVMTQANNIHASLRWIAVVIFLCSFPFSLYLPLWISWENQIIENSQAVTLALGAVISLVFGLCSSGKKRIFWLSVIPIWIIMTARELNWGAVFFDPTSMSEEGPSFASSKLWFHPYRTPVVLVLLTIFATGFILSKGPRIIADMLVSLEFPFFDLFGFVLAMLLSTAAEGHVHLSIDWWSGQHQILEETVETAAYIFLFAAQFDVWSKFPDNSEIEKL